MKERPIIFSAPMVRAILDGRKTQTRRVVRPQPEDFGGFGPPRWWNPPYLGGSARPASEDDYRAAAIKHCPYGVPGDRLWVRETWADTMGDPPSAVYRADGERHPSSALRWRPSIHMPRWASRLTLEIVSVRGERVQEISEEDALAEGALEFDSPTTFVDHGMQSIYLPSMGYARASFMRLWDSINAKRAAWESNPFVRVIEFRRVGE